ncbi:hypothetical protein [Prauserella halophila]|uniref:hypothetical protein n=1 Tax=Prauserella halophila TaxID=185641 RepID=UPI0020A32781|nr:hypothetical protein [Prauserella halophila]
MSRLPTRCKRSTGDCESTTAALGELAEHRLVEPRRGDSVRGVVFAGTDPVIARRTQLREKINGTDDARHRRLRRWCE